MISRYDTMTRTSSQDWFDRLLGVVGVRRDTLPVPVSDNIYNVEVGIDMVLSVTNPHVDDQPHVFVHENRRDYFAPYYIIKC